MTEEPEALPPDPALLNRQPKWFKPVFRGTIVASILFVFALLLAPPLLFRSAKKSDQATAISNLGQLYYALIAFSEEYASFPNDETAKLVKEKFPSTVNHSGSSSNALFRQLFAAELVEAEEIFYAKVSGTNRPDGVIMPGHLLEKGEVAFSYISGLSSKDDPFTPIVLTPLIPGTTKFDPEPFDGKAVVLRIDKTVGVYDIQKDGHIYDKGINLLSPKHPVWKGKTPDIRYPDL